jgi:hypothetical protein
MNSKAHEENAYNCDLDVLIISLRSYDSNPRRSGRNRFRPTYLISYVTTTYVGLCVVELVGLPPTSILSSVLGGSHPLMFCNHVR